MPVKIVNHLSEKDIKNIVSNLSSQQIIFRDGYSWAEVLPANRLSAPLYELQEVRLESLDGKKYNVGTTIEFCSDREVSMSKTMEKARKNLEKKYSIEGNDSSFNVEGSKTMFTVQPERAKKKDCIDVYPQGSRNVNEYVIRQDLGLLFDVSEELVNKAYETNGIDFNMRLLTNLTYPKISSKVPLHNQEPEGTGEFKFVNIIKPDVRFDDIGGCYKAKEELKRLAKQIKSPELMKEWGIEPAKGILLHGLSGTGKTMLAKAVTNEIDASFIYVRIPDVMKMWYGESEGIIKSIFDTAKKKAPSVVYFEELDSIAPRRSGSHEASQKIVGTMLEQMDGLEKLEGVTALASTNYLERIEPALLRPGRFTKLIEVPKPDQKVVEEIYRLKCAGKKVDTALDFGRVTAKSVGMTGDDIREVVRLSLEKNLDMFMSGKNVGPVTTDEFLKVIDEYKTSRGMLEKKLTYNV
ncbi:MAG: ATP-binding protein [Candidatus Aenigmatarchaeota archaeon]